MSWVYVSCELPTMSKESCHIQSISLSHSIFIDFSPLCGRDSMHNKFFVWSNTELQLEHDASRSQKFMIALAASPRVYHKTGIDFLMMPSIQHCRERKAQLAHRKIPNWRHQFILLKLFEYLSFAFSVIPQSSYTHRESAVIVGVCRQSMYDYMRHKTKDFHFLLPFSFPSLSIFGLPFLFHILQSDSVILLTEKMKKSYLPFCHRLWLFERYILKFHFPSAARARKWEIDVHFFPFLQASLLYSCMQNRYVNIDLASSSICHRSSWVFYINFHFLLFGSLQGRGWGGKCVFELSLCSSKELGNGLHIDKKIYIKMKISWKWWGGEGRETEWKKNKTNKRAQANFTLALAQKRVFRKTHRIISDVHNSRCFSGEAPKQKHYSERIDETRKQQTQRACTILYRACSIKLKTQVSRSLATAASSFMENEKPPQCTYMHASAE